MPRSPFMAASSLESNKRNALEKPRLSMTRNMSLLFHVRGPLSSSPKRAAAELRTKPRQDCHRSAHVAPTYCCALYVNVGTGPGLPGAVVFMAQDPEAGCPATGFAG